METLKEPLLIAEGYVYNFRRMVYYNRTAKKAFSAEWVADHDVDELRAALASRNPSDDWQLFLTTQPSKSVKEAFLAEISA